MWQVALVAADVLSAVLAIGLAVVIARGGEMTPRLWDRMAWTAVLLTALWMAFAARHPGYLPRPHRPLITTAHQCLVSVAAGSLVCIGLLYVLAPRNLADRTILVPASALMFALMVAARTGAAALAAPGPFVERYLIMGNGRRARAIIDELRNGLSPYKSIVGLIPVEPLTEPPLDVPVIGTVDGAPQVVSREAVTHLIVCQPQPLSSAVARSVADCEAAGAHVATMERAYESLTRRAPIFHVGDQWVAELDSATETLYASRVKRLFDVALAGAGLVATSPVILLLGLLVKLTSRGPAFYLQERIGREGKPFIFAKLRTMVEDAEARTGPVWAQERDPRVTGVGRFLRKSRIDELPQLWNVVKGDMSLIGPRPERPFFVERFVSEIPLYGKRLLVRPGITGWAQVNHRYDTCQDDVIEKLRYDLFYIGHVSLKLDLLILLRTIGVVLTRRGAH